MPETCPICLLEKADTDRLQAFALGISLGRTQGATTEVIRKALCDEHNDPFTKAMADGYITLCQAIGEPPS